MTNNQDITLIYEQSTGYIKDINGKTIAEGWSGNHKGKNNPDMQNVPCVGPLPQGLYKVGLWELVHGKLGPIVASLTQIEGETFGRDDFFIHGPSDKNYGEESEGCIVIPRPDRIKVKLYNPTYIKVVA